MGLETIGMSALMGAIPGLTGGLTSGLSGLLGGTAAAGAGSAAAGAGSGILSGMAKNALGGALAGGAQAGLSSLMGGGGRGMPVQMADATLAPLQSPAPPTPISFSGAMGAGSGTMGGMNLMGPGGMTPWQQGGNMSLLPPEDLLAPPLDLAIDKLNKPPRMPGSNYYTRPLG